MDTYMDLAGATACKPCTVNGAAAEPCALSGGYQLPYCDPSKPGTQDRRLRDMCVPCSTCSSEFYFKAINPDANAAALTFCYRPFNSY
jgi:hypothetical protein